MSHYMSPYMLDENEYIDFREVASLSVTNHVLEWKDYKPNKDISKLERKLIDAVKKKEINVKKYPTYNAAIFLYTYFDYFPKGCRIRMKPVDVRALYEKWGYCDMCFNPKKAQSESASALKKIPWCAPENAFAELMSELWKKGYISADSDSDALKKTAPHFTVNEDTEVLRKGLSLKRQTSANFDRIPKAGELKESDNFSGIKPGRKRINTRE